MLYCILVRRGLWGFRLIFSLKKLRKTLEQQHLKKSYKLNKKTGIIAAEQIFREGIYKLIIAVAAESNI